MLLYRRPARFSPLLTFPGLPGNTTLLNFHTMAFYTYIFFIYIAFKFRAILKIDLSYSHFLAYCGRGTAKLSKSTVIYWFQNLWFAKQKITTNNFALRPQLEGQTLSYTACPI